MTDPEVERIVREVVGSARLSGHAFPPEAVARIRRVAYGEITPEEAIAEAVASCRAREGVPISTVPGGQTGLPDSA